MASEVTWPGSKALLKILENIANYQDHPATATFRQDVRNAIIDGHREGILAGTDKQGKTLAKLAPSTLENRKGNGPPLAPSGALSRVYTALSVGWDREGGVMTLRARWDGIPFMRYHIEGRPANNLPKRDVAGIRPQTLAEIKRLHQVLMKRLLKG